MTTKTEHFDLTPDTFDGTQYPGTTYVEMGTNALVTVIGWAWNTAILSDGTYAERRNLYRPMWLVKAEQNERDAADERDTLSDALYAGAV